MNARALIAIALLGILVGAHAEDTDTRSAARDSYREFLRLAPVDDPRRPAALRRLADLELERAENLQVEGAGLDQAKAVYATAVELYRELLDTYPDFEGNDVVRYQLARAYEQSGDIDRAVDELARLTAKYPESSYAKESHFRRGEAYFSAGDYDLAAAAYASILATDNARASDFYQQAVYKNGWSLFRLGEYDAGLDQFLVLLNHELAPAGHYDKVRHDALVPGKRALLDDALRAMSISCEYLGGVESLGALLTRAGAPGFEFLLYRDLGDHYLDLERFSDAAGTYGAFVDRYPDDSFAPHLQLKVIATYRAAGFAEQELAAKESFVERYALTVGDGYWASHTAESAEDIVAALKIHLTELSRHYHATAEGDPATVDRAEHFYRAWLASFPADEDAPATHFLLAELLFTHDRYEQATAAYEATAYGYGPHERAAEAGYASLLAYAEQEKILAGIEQAAWQRRSIDGALRFSASFPQHAEANSVLVHAAERLFDLGEFEAAGAAAQTLVALSPPATPQLRRTAYTVIGHASFDQGDFANAEEAYIEVSNLSAPDDAESEALTERLAAAVYKQGEQRRDAGELDGAVDDFLRVAQVAPASAIRATAEYDAAAALIELGAWDRAAGVLESFRVAHGSHELAQEVTRKLSVVYLNAGRDQEAAVELRRMAEDATYPANTREAALWEAIDLYRKSGDEAGEATALGYFLTAFEGSLDRGIDARERLAKLAAASGDSETEELWQRDIVAAHASAAVTSERSLSAAAHASLALAEKSLPRFDAIKLTIPLKDNLRLKKQTMEALLDEYATAADYGVGAVTTAATYRIAGLYRGMATALMESERPADLNPAELEEYDFLLEEQAFPFEEKAIEVHEANAERTAQGVYDEWVKKSFTALAELMPARYAKFEKGETFALLSD